jgi:hypothetical protein
MGLIGELLSLLYCGLGNFATPALESGAAETDVSLLTSLWYTGAV